MHPPNKETTRTSARGVERASTPTRGSKNEEILIRTEIKNITMYGSAQRCTRTINGNAHNVSRRALGQKFFLLRVWLLHLSTSLLFSSSEREPLPQGLPLYLNITFVISNTQTSLVAEDSSLFARCVSFFNVFLCKRVYACDTYAMLVSIVNGPVC